jgi:hypothetical protein
LKLLNWSLGSRYELSDFERAAIKPFLPNKSPHVAALTRATRVDLDMDFGRGLIQFTLECSN